jgi:hypothetical protein
MDQFSGCIAFNFPGRFFDDHYEFEYDQKRVELINGEKNNYHMARIWYSKDALYKDAFKSGSRLLSELCWLHRIPIRDRLFTYGRGSKHTSGKNFFQRTEKYLINGFTQSIFQEHQHLALGFFREGFSSISPFYRFLSFYKIFEIPFSGKEIKPWINKALGLINDKDYTLKRLHYKGVKDIAEWLYSNGRNALAHASLKKNQFIVDINDHDHWQDIVYANDLLEGLTVKLCIEEMGITRPSWYVEPK